MAARIRSSLHLRPPADNNLSELFNLALFCMALVGMVVLTALFTAVHRRRRQRREMARSIAGFCTACGYEPSRHTRPLPGMRDGAHQAGNLKIEYYSSAASRPNSRWGGNGLSESLDQAINRQIQIQFGPMKSLPRSDHRPTIPFCRGCATQARVQTQWNVHFATVTKKNDQSIALKPQPLGAVSGDVDGASAHAKPQGYRHGIVSAMIVELRVRQLRIRLGRCIRH
jgi:hypothetical protein